MPNIQVTHNTSLNNARSESCIVVNPNNPMQVVSSSKKFNNIQTYDFILATEYSTDGGLSWNDSAPLPTPGFTLLTDPTLAWDDVGNIYLVGLSGNNPPAFNTIGIEIYKSTDGGQTWSAPNRIHTSPDDDKQWAAGDTNPASPFHGHVYAVWDDTGGIRFARTKDNGATWIGTGSSVTPAGTVIATGSLYPEINVAPNGHIYVISTGGSAMQMVVSTDGGDSFHSVTSPAAGITTLSVLPSPNGFPQFPGGSFRVLSLPTACVSGSTVVVAWADYREGVSRIYYALSTDGGNSWVTGPSGQPLLAGPLPANLHHFHPQLIFDPNGAIGCTFYEFGPKPVTPLIDVIMAQSFDGGTTFSHFTVTDAPWDPTVDAPWSHANPNMTFIGDYFGIDGSVKGFHPLWTDTRTGIQELFTAIVPEKKCMFIVNRSTLGQDEVDARRGLPGGAVIPDVFRVVVDGYMASELGISGPVSTLAISSPVAGMTIVPRGNVSEYLDYGPEVQRFTFKYDVDFGSTDTAFGFPTETKFVTLNVTAGVSSALAEIELIKQPNPFLLHGDTYWLSIDLRVFVVRQGENKFGVPGVSSPADAPRFIQQLMNAITPAQFDSLSPDEENSRLYIQPQDESGTRVYNFALAKVHYIGLIGATNVRVFFRLFQAQTTSGAFDFPPGTEYRRSTTLNPHGHPIALAGIRGTEYVTIPCFAEPRIDSTVDSMTRQTDDPNVKNIVALGSGAEVDTFFGCWLDINQPGVNRIPARVPVLNPDGPFNDPSNPPLSIQQAIIRNLHQCLIAEIAFDPVAIPVGKDPSNWDKLAQRNIAWSVVGSATAVTTFEAKPTPAFVPSGLPPDELMIDWGNTPVGHIASLYLPAIRAEDILTLAGKMYTSNHLILSGANLLQCETGGITYVPLPPGSAENYAGVLSIELPEDLPRRGVYTIVVRQVTNAYAVRDIIAIERERDDKNENKRFRKPRFWRRVTGAFQLSIPVGNKKLILTREERDFSVLRWIGEAIPRDSRWYKAFQFYLHLMAGRVKTFGGNPMQIPPTPSGNWKGLKCHQQKEGFWIACLSLSLSVLALLISAEALHVAKKKRK